GGGGRYNPTADSWAAVSTIGQPGSRNGHTAIWTGVEMVIWGGRSGSTRLADGGQYNPADDAWRPTVTVNAAAARDSHTAVWTGSEMLVWGGFDGTDYLDSLYSYIPSRTL